MKKFLSAAVLTLLLSVLIFSAGCSQTFSNPYFFYAMQADVTITVPQQFTAGKEEDFQNLCRETVSLLDEIEKSISATDKNSYISKFNAAPAGSKVALNKHAYTVLSLALAAYKFTEGYYNPAVYYSVLAYEHGFDKKNGEEITLPKDSVIQGYKNLSQHFDKLKLIEENGQYFAVKPTQTETIEGVEHTLKVDLGGIGKGYAVDLVDALFDKYGFENGNFNFGTSSLSCKKTSKGEAYPVKMTDPRSTYTYYFQTTMQNTTLSTGGDYRKFFIKDGVRYCHIIDPFTGKPVQTGITTATVIGGNAAENDAYTTAIMAMGKERAVQFINQKLLEKRVVFSVEENGAYGVITNMRAEEYTILKSNYTLLNTLSPQGEILLGS